MLFSKFKNCNDCESSTKCKTCDTGYKLNSVDGSCCKKYGCETCKTFPSDMDDGESCEVCQDG